jgi:hypothetical protein
LEAKGLTRWSRGLLARIRKTQKKTHRLFSGRPEVIESFNQETHFLRILVSDFCYVVNPGGYVGLNSAIDIGFAAGAKKYVYAMERVADIGINELVEVKTPEDIISIGKDYLNQNKKYSGHGRGLLVPELLLPASRGQ